MDGWRDENKTQRNTTKQLPSPLPGGKGGGQQEGEEEASVRIGPLPRINGALTMRGHLVRVRVGG